MDLAVLARRPKVPKRSGAGVALLAGGVGSGCRERLALLCPGPSLALRAVPAFELPLSLPVARRCPGPTSLRSSGRAGVVLAPRRPPRVLPAVSDAASAPCVVSCSGRSRSTAPPAGTGFRQGGGRVVVLRFGLVVGWGPVGGLSLPGPLRANQEPARRRKRRVASEGGGFPLRRTCACGGTLVRGTCPARTDWAVPRDVDTGFHAAMGISVALWLVFVGLCPCRFS